MLNKENLFLLFFSGVYAVHVLLSQSSFAIDPTKNLSVSILYETNQKDEKDEKPNTKNIRQFSLLLDNPKKPALKNQKIFNLWGWICAYTAGCTESIWTVLYSTTGNFELINTTNFCKHNEKTQTKEISAENILKLKSILEKLIKEQYPHPPHQNKIYLTSIEDNPRVDPALLDTLRKIDPLKSDRTIHGKILPPP